jgi:hypothetical protein
MIFIYVLLAFVAILFILLFINLFSKSKWFCNVMGWHKAPKDQGFDGCSLNGCCPRCGKKVLQDGQGNWFASSHQ